ncbi:MAG TPA: hypothetical protein VHU24_02865, partial [Solirubrobacterales bacterium]|nr:hypothetical protein [Solirubrobacterales bacterium]
MESTSANRVRRDALELASLRPSLDGGWPAAARWLTGPQHPGGGLAALDQPVGEPVVFRLRAENRWRVKGGVTLVPGRRTPGIARLRVAIRADGHRATLWSGYLGRMGAPLPSSLHFDAEIGRHGGAAEFDLVLEASGAGLDAVRWLDPVLEPAPATGGNGEAREAPVSTHPQTGPVQVDAPAGRPPAPGDGPLISILTPVHDPDPDHLDAMLASVAGQTRDAYELCLVDDGSRDPRVIERLGEAALADDRIHLV